MSATRRQSGRGLSRPNSDAPMLGGVGAPSAATTVLEELRSDFERIVSDTIAQVEACPAKHDPTFEGYQELLAAVRSATSLEGALLKRAIALVVGKNPKLSLIHLERPLPVHQAAKALFLRSDWAGASMIRRDAEVITREYYRPDLLVVDRAQQHALLFDIKRTVSSYSPSAIVTLRSRMMASALALREVLERKYDVPSVSRASIAIIDAAGDTRSEAEGILGLGDLDWLLRIDGAGHAIRHLRELYGAMIRAILQEHCEVIVEPQREGRTGEKSQSRIEKRTKPMPGKEEQNDASKLQAVDQVEKQNEIFDDVNGNSDELAGVQATTPSRSPGFAVGIATRRTR
ncbi:hypothetical protein JYP49_05005 [Nitratireductor aquimarinus]|uniref:hypothetical protein n=1 Tax=Nitratireductor TaxID=245876 RepID=UPI0019D3C7C7|nr:MULTISPECIES: hypothetical protein [Nitratireductor]MBN7775079.1 hypothetical protein [Nitratireductor pacificus]MBN7779940.1 hypothetical protein [Nitratireductor pacificus]MBN7788747.1 hypothetical protein [Nitratireductor aquimarinus]MBY6097466.1 hypothetical protein [Nitratireductor aquimarinus]MCA1260887.1 hypothetical protein [Nitratireductor aquimarinus]